MGAKNDNRSTTAALAPNRFKDFWRSERNRPGVQRRLYSPLGSVMSARSLIGLRNAKNRDHVLSDRREIAAAADLESGVICLIQQLQHRLIDLDGASLELRGHFGIGFGRDKRCDFGINPAAAS